MKSSSRIICCATLLLLIPLYLVKVHLEDFCDQYRAGTYLVDWTKSRYFPQTVPTLPNGQTGDKIIVMAKLEEEHTEWVEEELPDWQRAIYTVNPSKATVADTKKLTTPLNKGHESMAYLTYLIDHYDSLPSTIAFLHSHRAGFFMAWHVDAPLHDNVAAMRALQLDFVQRNGYVNLRCNWNPGCRAADRLNRHVTEQQKFLAKPKEIGAACCAQFAVSREQVLQRPREDYIRFRQWVIDTDKDDASSGRVMEFLWHVIFGQEAVYCPDEELCYFQVYGKC
ncbi:hypothetical protein KXX35_006660 [Aspergillus fumigatus]|nr:hypothetical protein KXX23_008127 [Aspergillus fumigatus]KAH1798372.1 hypothetical protein KXX20_002483 [Aspergillus fumigatus]KAH1827810.1 hypothetical protein KXX35_006660 [Aspergillus fumigatus]KAH2092040.1 hypothetical protein KXW86_005655 [Aspergillus fumigatus]KAH2606753.1 hypothetical protein KXW93_006225 [Aspergillus fumigatus]